MKKCPNIRLKVWGILPLLLLACDEPQLREVQPNNIGQGHFITVPLNPKGYLIHPLSGDSLDTPQYLLRGLPFEDNRIKLDEKKLNRLPLKKIYEQPLGTPKQSSLQPNTFPYKPGKKYYFEAIQQKTSDRQFVQMNGKDSIFSGTPFTLSGRVLDIEHPKPIKAEKSYWDKTRDYQITHWQNDQGLQSEYLWHVLEDKNGSIWMGTEGDGISRFDGEYFHNYSVENGLTTGLVMRFAQDHQDNIWMGTFDAGLLKYDGDKFIAYDAEAGFYESAVEHIFEDNQGNIWLGGSRFLTKKTGDTFFIFSDAEGYTDEETPAILQDNSGNIWLGCHKGITKFDGNNFYYYDLEGFDFPLEVFSGFIDKDGILWFSIWNNGLLRFDGESFEHITKDQGLVSNYISQIVQDKKGKIWFSSFEGLCSFDGQTFEHITEESGLVNQSLFGLGLTDDNSLLIGQNVGGLGLLKQRSIRHLSTKEGLFSNDITARVDYGGITYHGSFGDGITVQKDDKLENYTTKEGLMVDFIRSLAVGKKDSLYVGAQAPGFGVFDRSTYCHFTIDDESYDVMTLATFVDSKERLWLGLNENGAGYVENGEFVSIGAQDGLVSNTIFGINEDSRGNIWLHSPEGISKYDGQFLTNYTQREGLVQDHIMQISEDESGVLWISSRDYLARLDDTQLHYVIDEDKNLMELGGLMAFSKNRLWTGKKELKILAFEGDKVQATTLSSTGGLKNKGLSTLKKSNDGRLFIGSENGYDIITPDEFESINSPPRLRISHIDIDGIFQDLTQWSNLQFPNYSGIPSNLRLSSDQTHITIHFAANQWSAHDKIEYSYLMEGTDKQWSEASKEAKADYRNLAYGLHYFKVKARGESGTWSNPIVLQFYIESPWYLTTLAKAGYVIIVILCIVGIIKLRTFQLKQKQEQLELEIDSATKEITAQRDRAEQSERYKEQFLANMSHEIRTPIHAISGMLKILKRNTHPEFQDQFLDAMSKSTENLSKLLNDVLDLSKIESGKLTIVDESFDLRANIRLSIELLQGKAEEKGLSLEFFFSEELPKMVKGDALRLTQILINLINNAIKFSEQGKITVSVKPEIHGIQFTVSDEGKGISEDDQARIFSSFEQVETQHTTEGTGLGLTITKRLIEIQHGTLKVTSEPGKGSVFSFILPLQAYEGVLEETRISESELKSIGKQLKGLRILLAEDTEFNVMVAKDDLLWYFPESTIEVAKDGKEALSMYERTDYDLVLMDVQMPHMNGYQSTRKIRELELSNNLKKKPIIAMTASLLEKDIQKCLNAGMDDFLPKPYRSDELVLKISRTVNHVGSLN